MLLLLVLWLLAARRDSDQDKLTTGQESAAASGDPEKLCSSKATYDNIKRELFRRAAQLRGSDQAAFDRLSAYAAIRMENPVMESEDQARKAVACSGTLALDLPPGVAVVGGRRSLSSDVDYSVQPAADGSGNVVLLKNAEAIITPLATLGRTAQPAQPAPTVQQTPSLDTPAVTEPRPGPQLQPQPQRQPQPQPDNPAPRATARPSFNCANARTRGEVAVCADSGLASLDRQMAGQFGRAMSGADPGQRALLERTRARFLRYRDQCRSDACIADAYRGRIREISDIAQGRWRPE
ncbi:MAG TPA: hypothetical protein VM145_04520 [Sphingomicrobium sp.]|nr:hypothetical protein [Sphingomicrobium sp.]